MTKCSIVWCGAKKGDKNPELTLHRFPKNVALRQKWLEAVGVENIKPRLKVWYICSLHFEKDSFNRTLDVIRLREVTVPSIFLKPRIREIQQCAKTSTSNITTKELMENYDMPLGDKTNIQDSLIQCSPLQLSNFKFQAERDQIGQEKKIKALKDKCTFQKLKIKRLHEMVRKRNKKIANLNAIIKELVVVW